MFTIRNQSFLNYCLSMPESKKPGQKPGFLRSHEIVIVSDRTSHSGERRPSGGRFLGVAVTGGIVIIRLAALRSLVQVAFR